MKFEKSIATLSVGYVLGCLAIMICVLVCAIVGAYYAFCASVILGVIVFFLAPLYTIGGALILCFDYNMFEAFLKFIGV